MQDSANRKSWRTAYEAALLEHDSEKLRPMILEAQKAIQEETRRLWYAGSLNRSERQSLDAASRYLAMLYSFANKHEHRDKIA